MFYWYKVGFGGGTVQVMGLVVSVRVHKKFNDQLDSVSEFFFKINSAFNVH